MKKVIILIIGILLLSGCDGENKYSDYEKFKEN